MPDAPAFQDLSGLSVALSNFMHAREFSRSIVVHHLTSPIPKGISFLIMHALTQRFKPIVKSIFHLTKLEWQEMFDLTKVLHSRAHTYRA